MPINNITGLNSNSTVYGADLVTSTTTVAKTKVNPTTAGDIPDVALKSVASGTNAIPQLPDPLSQLSGMIAAPSLGADILSLVQELMDDERRANNEQRIAESKAVVEELHNQADDMRTQAAVNLGLGLTTAAIQISASVVQTAMSSATMKNSLSGKLSSEQVMASNQKVSGISEGIKGFATATSSVKEFVSSLYDASMKDRDAKIEMIRAYAAQLESLNDALKEVIRNARENQNAIQQNTNQTRVKILS